MAHPRVFISSTYYDLKNVRADIERYIKDRGFDPILHERGQIPYGSDAKLEEYCYTEIEHCDILISIIGGRFGSSSSQDSGSISQRELKTAISLGRQVYIFVEKSVLSEYRTYKMNKGSNDIRYASVDNIAIYQFMDEVFSLPLNNQVAPFETSSDITEYLQEQWSGLFQRLLREAARQKEVVVLENLKSTTETLNQLVTYLTEERRSGDQHVKEILLSYHPIFDEIRGKIAVPYRVFFTNKEELIAFLKARQYIKVNRSAWDEDTSETHEEWYKGGESGHLLKIAFEVFDENGKLKVFTPDEWKSEWVIAREIQENEESSDQ